MFPKQYDLLEELAEIECILHGSCYKSFCLETTCVESNKFLLCQHCIDDHPTQHTHVKILDICSNKLLQDFIEFKGKFDNDKHRLEQKSAEVPKYIDELFDNFEQSMLALLRESRNNLKIHLLNCLQKVSSLDAFHQDLVDLSLERTTTKDKIQSRIKTFSEKLAQFNEVRELLCGSSRYINHETEAIISNTRNQLTVLLESVENSIRKDLHIAELTGKKWQIFDFYINNTTPLISSKDISKLSHINNFKTSHAPIYWINRLLFLGKEKFVTCSGDTTIRIWDFDKTGPEVILRGHTDMVYNLLMLSSGRLCSASQGGMIKIWNLEKASCERTLVASPGFVNPLIELPGDILISGGEKSVKFWNLRSRNQESACVRTLLNRGICRAMILLSNDEIACASEKNVNIFKIHGPEFPVKKLIGHTKPVRDLILMRKGDLVISSSIDTTMRMWDVQRSICVRTFRGFSPCYKVGWFNEKVVATAYENGDIKLWNVYSGECLKDLSGQEEGVFRTLVNSNGVLLRYGFGNKVTFWSD